jgi:hypothetical protein
VNSRVRYTHVKSKNGCKNCKTRHVKCDELRPQWYVSFIRVTRNRSDRGSRKCFRRGQECCYVLGSQERSRTPAPLRLSSPSSITAHGKLYTTPYLQLFQRDRGHPAERHGTHYVQYLASKVTPSELGRTKGSCLWGDQFPMYVELDRHLPFHSHGSSLS